MRFSVIALLCLLPAFATCADTLRIAAENSWPPYSDARGLGLSYRIVTEALKVVGHDIHIEVVPYARALRLADSGDADAVWNVTLDDSTRQRFHFGQQPLLRATGYFYYKRGNEKAYQSLVEVPDQTRIAVINDYEYGNTFVEQQQRFILIRVATQTQIVKLLQSGRADMAIMFEQVAQYTLQQSGQTEALSKGARNHVSDIYLAFNRNEPSSAQYARDLDHGLIEIQSNGTYQKIMDAQ